VIRAIAEGQEVGYKARERESARARERARERERERGRPSVLPPSSFSLPLPLRSSFLFCLSLPRSNPLYVTPTAALWIFRLVDDMHRHTQVAICYDSALLNSERENRQQQLMARWGFRCGCPRCRATDDPADALLTAARLPPGPARRQLELEMQTCCAMAEHALNSAAHVLQTLARQDAPV